MGNILWIMGITQWIMGNILFFTQLLLSDWKERYNHSINHYMNYSINYGNHSMNYENNGKYSMNYGK